MDELRAWFESLLRTLVEGEARAQALAIGVRALDGLRKLFLLHHLQMVACLLCALSLFALGFVTASQWPLTSLHALPATFFYCLAMFAVSAIYLAVVCSSRVWVAAFGLDRQVEHALRWHRSPAPAAVDPEALAQVIEKIVEKKLEEARKSH